ncbi:META domain-containing protein [Erythrobacter donghaensis]|uniref:META domain-containing protein n=1 Tax=Erythrobacter donghaensis TaxID=267135 RepID=UPI0013025760|nr:META domain-containing protein [Erythrobacter donghaensis]
MKRLTVFAATAATLALGACVTVPDTHPLTGTEWQLVAIDTSGSTTTLTPALQSRHTIAFMDAGEMQLQLDCNRGRSTWTAGQPANGAGSIAIGPVAGTKMLCPEPSFGDELARLSEAQRYTTTLDGRQLVIETGALRYTFTSAE